MTLVAFPVREYRVIDGDTVEVDVELFHRMAAWRLHGGMTISLRLVNVDAPDVRKPASELEIAAGKVVADAVTEWMELHNDIIASWDDLCPWGRIVGDIHAGVTPSRVECGERGETLTDYLVARGLVAMTEGTRHDWTEAELQQVLHNAMDVDA